MTIEFSKKEGQDYRGTNRQDASLHKPKKTPLLMHDGKQIFEWANHIPAIASLAIPHIWEHQPVRETNLQWCSGKMFVRTHFAQYRRMSQTGNRSDLSLSNYSCRD